MAASNNDWRVPTGDSNELDRLVEIHKLRVKWSELQRQLDETRTSRRQDGMSFDYPILMGYERTLAEKEIATIKVKLMLLGAKM